MTIKKRTRNSFIASLILHTIIFASVGGVLPKLYTHYETEPKPFPYETTEEVDFVHATVLRPAIRRKNALKRERAILRKTTLATSQNLGSQSVNNVHPNPLSASHRQDLISTYVKLDDSENERLSVSQDSKDRFESISEPNIRVKSDVGNVKIDRGYGSTKSLEENADRDAQIGSALKDIAGEIVNSTTDRKIDLIFLIDTSGSMLENIHSVAKNLSDMISIFRESELDYALGVVKFKYAKLLPFPLTTDYTKYERLLMNVRCGGDERAYDAVVESIRQVKFRSDSTKRFILITDENLKGSYSVIQTIGKLRAANITLDIIGLDTPLQRNLAKQTGGSWYPIPK